MHRLIYTQDWEAKQKDEAKAKLESWRRGEDGDMPAEDEEDDGLPFACFICRRPWAECQDPVITRCKHYFCEQCALKHNAKSGKCFVCEQATGGIFNVANEIIRKYEDKAKSARQ